MENMLKTNLRVKVSLKKDVPMLDMPKINDKISNEMRERTESWMFVIRSTSL